MDNKNRFEPGGISQSYAEYLVAKKPGGRDILIKTAIILAGVILAFLMLVMTLGRIPAASFLFLVIILYLTWYALSYTNIEFEYIILQGELQIDKIYGRRRRKRIYEIQIADMEKIAPKKSIEEYLKHTKITDVFFACSSADGENVYGIVYRGKSNQKAVLYLNVIRKTLDAFKYYKRSALEIDPAVYQSGVIKYDN